MYICWSKAWENKFYNIGVTLYLCTLFQGIISNALVTVVTGFKISFFYRFKPKITQQGSIDIIKKRKRNGDRFHSSNEKVCPWKIANCLIEKEESSI